MTLTLISLSANVGSGATSAKLSAPLPTEMAQRVWFAIDAYTPNCEIVRGGGSVPGNVVQFAPVPAPQLKHSHAMGAHVVVLEDTLVTPQLFGALPDTGTDCTTALQNAINATGRVYLPPGRYPITGISTVSSNDEMQLTLHLSGACGSAYSVDHPSVLVPFGPGVVADMIRISKQALHGPPAMIQLENITIDGQSTAQVGVHVNQGQNLVFNNVSVLNCRDGFFIDGAAAALENRVMEVLLNNCYTNHCSGHGYRIDATKKVIGAFSVFTLLNCSSESDHVGCRVDGTGGGALTRIESSQFQNSFFNGIEVSGATVSIGSCYVEVHDYSLDTPPADLLGLFLTGGSPVPGGPSVPSRSLENTGTSGPLLNTGPTSGHLGNAGIPLTGGPLTVSRHVPICIYVTQQGRVSLSDTNAGSTHTDATSTIFVHNSHVNAVGAVRTPARLGRMADDWRANGLPWSTAGWGPPNYPTVPGNGAVYPKGFAYTDHMGVEWVCTTAGTSVKEAAFIARYGRILRPITKTDLTNGSLLWFPHEDMVVTRVSLVITADFVPASGVQNLSLGTLRKRLGGPKNGDGDDLIVVAGTKERTIESQLKRGTVLVSTNNPNDYGRLRPAGKEMFFTGTLPSGAAPEGHRISLFTPSVPNAWKAGDAVLVVEGYYLKYD